MTPEGPTPLGDLTTEQVAWLKGAKSVGRQLITSRMAVKLLQELGDVHARLVKLGMVQARPAAREQAQPASPAAAAPAAERFAVVPYIPSQPKMEIQAAPAPVARSPPAPATFDFNMKSLVMQFIRPYVWPVMMILKLSWWLPILVHIFLGFHLVCGMAFLAKNPEMLVVWAFKLLDLVPQYASYASERISSQIATEVSNRFR